MCAEIGTSCVSLNTVATGPDQGLQEILNTIAARRPGILIALQSVEGSDSGRSSDSMKHHRAAWTVVLCGVAAAAIVRGASEQTYTIDASRSRATIEVGKSGAFISRPVTRTKSSPPGSAERSPSTRLIPLVRAAG